MVALYERPDIRKRNETILRLFRAGELSRKEIAAQKGVSLDVVNNVVKKARAHTRRHGRRRCTCGARRR